MPSEFWGELVLPKEEVRRSLGFDLASKPEDLVGTAVVATTSADGSVRIDPLVPKPKPMKVTINGIQLGLPESISSRNDEIGEAVTEITLSEAALNRLYEEHGKKQITQTQLDAIMGALQPTMEIAEEIKKTLTDRGWTYEEAERIAGDILRDSIANAMKGIQ